MPQVSLARRPAHTWPPKAVGVGDGTAVCAAWVAWTSGICRKLYHRQVIVIRRHDQANPQDRDADRPGALRDRGKFGGEGAVLRLAAGIGGNEAGHRCVIRSGRPAGPSHKPGRLSPLPWYSPECC